MRGILKDFEICVIRIFTMKIEKLYLRDNISVCPGAFLLLRGRAPAQLRGNFGWRKGRTAGSWILCILPFPIREVQFTSARENYIVFCT
jgi:hypothetical protein